MKELLIWATGLPSLFSLTSYLLPIKSLPGESKKRRKKRESSSEQLSQAESHVLWLPVVVRSRWPQAVLCWLVHSCAEDLQRQRPPSRHEHHLWLLVWAILTRSQCKADELMLGRAGSVPYIQVSVAVPWPAAWASAQDSSGDRIYRCVVSSAEKSRMGSGLQGQLGVWGTSPSQLPLSLCVCFVPKLLHGIPHGRCAREMPYYRQKK